jgi:hypothetical protein
MQTFASARGRLSENHPPPDVRHGCGCHVEGAELTLTRPSVGSITRIACGIETLAALDRHRTRIA